jgi:DNA-binding NarL/FixJ family response regulator
MANPPATRVPASEEAGGTASVRFAQSLSSASTFEELERAFARGFGRLMAVPMYGFKVLDPATLTNKYNVAVNVSDVFVVRYDRAMDVDPLLLRTHDTGRGVYNLAMMSVEEWEETVIYRDAYATHRMRHVTEVPIFGAGQLVGALHYAAPGHAAKLAEVTDERDFAAIDLRVAEAVAGVLGVVIARIQSGDRTERELEQALAALELTGTAVVISDPEATELRLNDAARRMIAGVVDGEAVLHDLMARPSAPAAPFAAGGFSRRADIELTTGQAGVLQAHSNPLSRGGVVTVLELQPEQPHLVPAVLNALTARESEVALLLSEGLADREIAERLVLSNYTVSQYVKRIYRKLGVDSRVALTRLILGFPASPR